LQRLAQRGGRGSDARLDLLLQPFALQADARGAAIFGGALGFEQGAQQAVRITPPGVAELAVAIDRLLNAFDGALESDQLDRHPGHAPGQIPVARETGVAAAMIVGGAVGDADQPARAEHRFAMAQGDQEESLPLAAKAVAPRLDLIHLSSSVVREAGVKSSGNPTLQGMPRVVPEARSTNALRRAADRSISDRISRLRGPLLSQSDQSRIEIRALRRAS
jgi:hypothetical protein